MNRDMRREDDLDPARSLLNAIALAIPLWIVIGTAAYLLWWA